MVSRTAVLNTLRTGWLGYLAALAAVALVSVGISLVQRFAQISNQIGRAHV